MTQEFNEFIHTLVRASEKVIKPWYANLQLEVEHKSDETPVTIADRRAEEVMRDLIHKKFPGHGIIGEEFGNENENAEFVWVLDPIDGTISFASGCPLFGTLIALLHDGKPILGAINLPALNQLCIGDNETTTFNSVPVRMRACDELTQATLLTSDVKTIETYQNKNKFEKLLGQTKLFRTWGDCYGYVLLACGWADIMLDPIMNPWDLLALIPIIQGANGVITTWDGKDAATGNSSLAANKTLHPQVLEILK